MTVREWNIAKWTVVAQDPRTLTGAGRNGGAVPLLGRGKPQEMVLAALYVVKVESREEYGTPEWLAITKHMWEVNQEAARGLVSQDHVVAARKVFGAMCTAFPDRRVQMDGGGSGATPVPGNPGVPDNRCLALEYEPTILPT